jgi:hypothetical protein
MQIRYEITPGDHLELLNIRMGLKARMGRFLLCVAGVCVGLIGYKALGSSTIIVIVTFATLAIMQILLPFISHRRIYYQNPSLFSARTVTIDDEGLRSESESGNTEVKWTSFVKFIEGTNIFLLYRSKDAIGIIPKRVFSNQEQLAEFNRLLASKIPKA